MILLSLVNLACFMPLPTSTGTDSAGDTAADSAADTADSAEDSGSGGCVQKGVVTSAESWALPTGYPEGTFAATYDTAYATDPAWSLLDLDGNGRSDIVVTTDAAAGAEGLGTTSWLYASNTGSKFRATLEPWSLPAGFADATFAATYDASTATPTWSLADLDGDGLTDLVVTRDTTSAVDALGTSVWLVYPNTGAGYGAAVPWNLPGGFATHALSAIYDDNVADPTWALADVTGDGKVDFVVTHDSTTVGIGTTSWLVYENTGKAFSATGTEWLLPEGYADLTFDHIYDDDTTDAPTWGLVDLDGNGRTDLVVTRDDGAGVSGLGTSTWLWYSNTGSRFRTASEKWALPEGYPALAFATLSDATADGLTWGLTDLDRDGLVDFVVTRNDAAAIAELGTSRWQLFKNDGETGFSATNSAWPLPEGYPTLTFEALYDDQAASPAWSVTDLDHDGTLDLVITKSDDSSTFGTTEWSRYAGKCK